MRASISYTTARSEAENLFRARYVADVVLHVRHHDADVLVWRHRHPFSFDEDFDDFAVDPRLSGAAVAIVAAGLSIVVFPR